MKGAWGVHHAESRVRVVVVDDDQYYRETLKNQLEERGLTVSTFSGRQALLQSSQVAAQADIVVFDWALRRVAGIELLVRLRQAGVTVPIVFLADSSLVEHEREAFQEGAIDFIPKSRGVDILMRRLTVIACRNRDTLAGRLAVPALRLGALTLRPDTSRAEWRGRDVGLTTMEYKIVALLAARPGECATHRAIYDAMRYVGFVAGQGAAGVKTNVRANIKRIRRKFLRLDPAFGEIVNRAGVGYAWRRLGVAESPSSTAKLGIPESPTPAVERSPVIRVLHRGREL